MASAAAAMRKTVTVVFCDLVDSTGLAERLDAERLRELLGRWYEAMREPIERHGGTVEKFIGDAVMAVFGVPTVHEDDALRAVRAAVEMRDALERLNTELGGLRQRPLAIRIGVNTGEVVTGTATATLVSGDAVNTAKRLEQAAGAGEILIGAATRRLVDNAVVLEAARAVAAKGKTQPVETWRVLGTIAGADAVARRLDAPLVGRGRELDALRGEVAAALRDRSCRVVTVFGAAGIGKSRLARELLDTLDGVAVLAARCHPYGDGISLLPLSDLVRSAGGEEGVLRAAASEPDGALITARLCGATRSVEETQWAVRRLLETLARDRPIVLCVEDLHWAQPAFLDLLEYVAGWTRDAAVVILCLARQELLDARPHWPGAAVTLPPLSADESQELLDALAAEWPLDAVARARAAGAAEGNPLFLEQIVAMAADGHPPDAVPPTIQALLGARLDALAPVERAVLERASVIGRDFSRGALSELSPFDERPVLAPTLLTLVRKELVRPHRTEFPGDDGFRFRHALIRDAAYGSIPKSTRAELHEAFAAWLERHGGEQEVVGHHLEQAWRYGADLGRFDDGLATRAAELLGAAGMRAAAHGDAEAARSLLRRSLTLLPPRHALRVALLRELSAALWASAELDAAELTLAESIALARTAGDRRSEWYGRLEQAARNAATQGGTDALGVTAEQAIEVFDELGDSLGLARAWRRVALVAHWSRRWADCAEASERAVRYAEESGDEQERARSADMLCTALVYGPARVPEAIDRVERLHATADANPVLRANVATSLAALLAMRGDFERARELCADAGATYEELGLRMAWVGWNEVAALVEQWTGDTERAIAHLQAGYDVLDGGGQAVICRRFESLLALALARVGDTVRARRYTRAATTKSSDLDADSRARLRAAHALLAAGPDAQRLAREAIAIAAGIDDLNLQAEMQLTLACVADDSRAEAEAVRLFEAKGNLAAAASIGVWSRQP